MSLRVEEFLPRRRKGAGEMQMGIPVVFMFL